MGLNGSIPSVHRIGLPNLSPEQDVAHACAGDVWFEVQWLKIEEAQRLAACDQRLAEYRQFPDRWGRSATGQEKLARWCQKKLGSTIDEDSFYGPGGTTIIPFPALS